MVLRKKGTFYSREKTHHDHKFRPREKGAGVSHAGEIPQSAKTSARPSKDVEKQKQVVRTTSKQFLKNSALMIGWRVVHGGLPLAHGGEFQAPGWLLARLVVVAPPIVAVCW